MALVETQSYTVQNTGQRHRFPVLSLSFEITYIAGKEIYPLKPLLQCKETQDIVQNMCGYENDGVATVVFELSTKNARDSQSYGYGTSSGRFLNKYEE